MGRERGRRKRGEWGRKEGGEDRKGRQGRRGRRERREMMEGESRRRICIL